jgi:hypothetical protein
LAAESSFDGFERTRRRVAALLVADSAELEALITYIADLTEIGPSVPPLLSVASYYESTLERAQLWRGLRRILENKQTPTSTAPFGCTALRQSELATRLASRCRAGSASRAAASRGREP